MIYRIISLYEKRRKIKNYTIHGESKSPFFKILDIAQTVELAKNITGDNNTNQMLILIPELALKSHSSKHLLPL
jgi:hypothetical protein